MDWPFHALKAIHAVHPRKNPWPTPHDLLAYAWCVGAAIALIAVPIMLLTFGAPHA